MIGLNHVIFDIHAYCSIKKENASPKLELVETLGGCLKIGPGKSRLPRLELTSDAAPPLSRKFRGDRDCILHVRIRQPLSEFDGPLSLRGHPPRAQPSKLIPSV